MKDINNMQFLEDSKKIVFDEKEHKYRLDEKELISVTTFISLFSEGFDKDGSILKRCAIKAGVSEEDLKQKWREKGDKAAIAGKLWHKTAEEFIRHGKIRKNKFAPIVEKFAKQYKFKGELFSECLLFDDEILISGTADIVQIIDNKMVQIHDFKLTEKKPSDYAFGKYMKYPIQHLPDSKLTKFSLQISLYLYILSSKYGYEIGPNNYIFWIDKKKNDAIKIPVQLRLNEVMDMIAFYTYQKSLEKNNIV